MNVKIYFADRQNKLNAGFLLRRRLRKAICGALKYENFHHPCEISLTFVDNEGIREMNREYRNKDSATDVLSFPMYEFSDGESFPQDRRVELGDIVISLERAKEQSIEFGHSYEREAAFLCVHSVLHLLGYDHERSAEEEEDMCQRQREIMVQLGYKIN